MLLLFWFLDLQSWLMNQLLQKCGPEEALASAFFCKQRVEEAGNQGNPGKRWEVNMLSHDELEKNWVWQ